MKKLIKLILPIALVLALAFSFSACAMSLTCISHIDSDRNGKCDNCGTAMEVPREDIENIEITKEPAKTYYARNEELDISGGEITVTFNDGKPDEVVPFEDEGVTITAPNMSSDGKKMVQVKYGGFTDTYMIEVGDARFTVTFDLNYDGAEALPTQAVTINGYATEPEDPTRDGFSFLGWFSDKECTTPYRFGVQTVTGDVTLYAGWAASYTVTYDANYDGGVDKTAATINGKADSTITPDDRDGYIFAGWYSDPECTQQYNFNADVTGNLTLYAKWVSSSTEMVTITLDNNYEGAPAATTVSVPSGSTMSQPANPSRADVTTKGHQVSGFSFLGWYTDAECNNEFDFSSVVSGDMTLYAKWSGEYIFEAEHISLTTDGTPGGTPIVGSGASGGATGPDMVESIPLDHPDINASNGYYVSYLFAPGLALTFNIQSDRDVADATIVLRIGAENSGYAINPSTSDGTTDSGTRLSQYIISLNDEPINYDVIEVEGGWPEFQDYELTVNAPIKAGNNVITLTTANMNGMGGTMAASAPIVDCIKITTSAELSWEPVTGNEFGQ